MTYIYFLFYFPLLNKIVFGNITPFLSFSFHFIQRKHRVGEGRVY